MRAAINCSKFIKEKRFNMKIRTNIKAGIGGSGENHNEKMTSDKRSGLTVKTNVKAGVGGTGENHNEKMASDNNNSIEQKKTIGKKLRLSKETIRELRDSDLKAIVGGALNNSAISRCWASGCTCPNG